MSEVRMKLACLLSERCQSRSANTDASLIRTSCIVRLTGNTINNLISLKGIKVKNEKLCAIEAYNALKTFYIILATECSTFSPSYFQRIQVQTQPATIDRVQQQ